MDALLQYTKDPEDDFYSLIGCDELSSTEQIIAEYKAKALLCHPDKCPEDQIAAQKFAKIQRAKEILCDPEKRKQYDQWYRSGICMSYSSWCAKKDSIHTSMHWASKVKKEPMITDIPNREEEDQVTELKSMYHSNINNSFMNSHGWVREDNDLLRKFRNYEI